MGFILLTQPRALAGSLATLLLLQVQTVSAGLFTTERTVANFRFNGTALDYDPSPRLVRASDPVSGSSSASDANGPLHIDEGLDNFGNLKNVSFNLFGSVPPAASLPEIDLIKDSLKALRADNKGAGSVAFLAERDTVTGSLANQYRSAGVFVLLNGVDEVNWINGYKDAAAIAELLNLEEGPAVPFRGR